MSEEDGWDAFGSDEEEDTDDEGHDMNGVDNHHAELVAAADAAALCFTKAFLQANSEVPLTQRHICISLMSNNDNGSHKVWQDRLSQRGIQIHVVDPMMASPDQKYDGGIIDLDDSKKITNNCVQAIVPGGIVLLVCHLNHENANNLNSLSSASEVGWKEEGVSQLLPVGVWDWGGAEWVVKGRLLQVTKRPCLINMSSCPWKPPPHKRVPSCTTDATTETYGDYEYRMAAEATVTPSVYELNHALWTRTSLDKAQRALQTHGYVVLKQVLGPSDVTPWGEAVLNDLAEALERIQTRTNVNLLHPHNDDESSSSVSFISNYREMAMREDLRVDLRTGPRMSQLRSQPLHYTTPDIVNHSQQHDGGYEETNDGMIDSVRSDPLRGNKTIMAVCQGALNPSIPDLAPGNFGRYNFGGAGPDGSPQPMRVGQIGSVVSLPGAADQAIHADTPHLFESVDCLAPHYINVFFPGQSPLSHTTESGDSPMGGTAVVHGSHSLSVTARLMSTDDDSSKHVSWTKNGGSMAQQREELHRRIIRPSLALGDALIFDCRILHFGLANTTCPPPIIPNDSSCIDTSGWRPMLYMNITHAWFHDPKNWNDRQAIFQDDSSK